MFPEENSDLLFHKEYSYANCKFECTLSYANNEVYEKLGKICIPWFFPTSNDSITICDPWIANYFFQIMSREIPDSLCSHCLPDCSSTSYESTLNLMPFESCDATSLGVSQFCKLDMKSPQPMLENVIYQILKEFTDVDQGYYKSYDVPEYLEEMDPSIRYYGNSFFKQSSLTYNAFDQDVAMVEIIYQKSTLVQIQNQLAMTWIDYLSAVGGLLGLVLGMGIFSAFELVWLFLRTIAKKLRLSHWIA